VRARSHSIHNTRQGFTLIELLVVIAVIGILMSIALPAVQQSREAARQTSCRNNLRQLGLGLLNFESAYGRLPPGRDASNGSDHSWVTAVLPFLEQSVVYSDYDYAEAWDAPANVAVSETQLSVARCPSAVESWAGKMDYGGNYGSILTGLTPGYSVGRAWESGTLPAANLPFGVSRKRGVSLAEISDGTSNTFLVVEDTDRPAGDGGMWSSGNNCLAHDNGPINDDQSNEIYSLHPGGAFALRSDGSASFLSESIDSMVLGAFCTRASGEVP